MKVTRIIHPIGQGGFYTETLCDNNNEINVVYDCGGFDNYGTTKMQEYLDGYLHTGKLKKKIEAVFISHFHADHINGLQHLLENAEVTYLILPQLTEEILMEAFVYNNSRTSDNTVNNFLINLYRGDLPYGSEETQTRIIQVNYANDNVVHEDFNIEELPYNAPRLNAWEWERHKPLILSKINFLTPSTILYFGKWLYIPYNPQFNIENADKLKRK